MQEITPLLPELVEKLMLPAEKMDSIRVLNVYGLGGGGGPALTNGQSNGHASNGSSFGGLGASSVLNTMLNAEMLLLVIREALTRYARH